MANESGDFFTELDTWIQSLDITHPDCPQCGARTNILHDTENPEVLVVQCPRCHYKFLAEWEEDEEEEEEEEQP